MKTKINKYLDSIGAPGSLERLKAIAALDLGARSEAAKRVVARREKAIQERKLKERFNFYRNGGDLGPTGHGPDICFSDADSGL